MKKRQAKRVLDAEIKAFGHRISLLTFEDYIISSQFKDAHCAFKKDIQHAKNHPDRAMRKLILKDGIIGTSSTGTDVTKDPAIHFRLASKSIKAHDKEFALLENLNRQYSWLLVSAYEAYERFLKELYACMGFLDMAFWRCDDYGAVSPSGIGRLKLRWFKDRVLHRSNPHFRHGTEYAMQRFRQAFPWITRHEGVSLSAVRTSLYSDAILQQRIDTLAIDVTCRLVERLRHAIVHSQGIVSNGQKFCDEIGVNGERKRNVVLAHLKSSPQETHIWLVYDKKGLLDYKFLDLRISHILETLCAHACLIYKACISHFGEKAYWDRKDSVAKSQRKPPKK